MKGEKAPISAIWRGYTDKPGISEILGMGVRTTERLIERRAIPFYRIGGSIRFDIAEVREHLRKFNREPTADELAEQDL